MSGVRGLAPTLVLARRNVSRASARSVLAVVAVVIGVVAIGAIGAGGEAFKQDQAEAYEGFGGTATVDPVVRPDDPESRTFSDAEIGRMRRAVGSGTVVPVVESFSARVESPDGELIFPVQAQVKAVGDPGRFYEASSGAIPDNWRRTVVIGSRVASENDIAVGDRVEVAVDGQFDRSFRVVAVLEPQGFAGPLSADRSVFVPLAQFDDPAFDRAVVRVSPADGGIESAERRIEAAFNARERTVRVTPVQEQREQFERSFRTINRFLVGIGAISLLVAAVTIANTMLMSVIEREGEIGLLRAVGYPKRAVVTMLVAEATMLGLVGAVVGVPIALAVGMVINDLLLGAPLAFTPTAVRFVVGGAVVGVLTALVAGVYPAWTAANAPPVEALE